MMNLLRWCHREPTLEDILSDSIVRDVMEADGVDPHELVVMLRDVGRELERGSSCRFPREGKLSEISV